jgi:glycosyltransferase involved in cell wall biosynthesis
MKIAHVTLYPPKGGKHISTSGVASYSKNLITNLAENNDQQTVICETLGGTEKSYQEDGIEVRRVFEKNPGFITKIHAALKQANPDVVHIQQELALFGGIATAYLLQWLVFLWRDKVVITLHGVVDPHKIDAAFVKENNSRLPVWAVRLAFRIIYAPLMKWAKKIIVHEDYFKSIMVQSYGISPEKIVVIPHGVEPLHTMAQSEARQQLKLPQDANVALFMGYATGYKGIDLLIEGFGDYAKDHNNAYLLIGAGKHPKLQDDQAYLKEYARLQKKAAKLLPKGQYAWHGFIAEEDITAYYSASDVSLYPYTTAMSSSGPMSFAIGYEKPFLVSVAFEEIFQKYPLLLFDRTAGSLANKLNYFFEHRHEYDTVSRTLKKERTWSRVAGRTLQTYQHINSTEGAYESAKDITTG